MLAVLRYRHVLVAYDGSPDADLALEHAVGVAQAFRARLALVSVVPPAPAFAWQAPGGGRAAGGASHQGFGERRAAGGVGAGPDASQQDFDERLRAAADRIPDDLPLTTRLLDGDPAHEILRAAREGEHDLIVMGSRGRGRMTAALLGSVPTHVMHDAGVPVMIIPRPHEAPALGA